MMSAQIHAHCHTVVFAQILDTFCSKPDGPRWWWNSKAFYSKAVTLLAGAYISFPLVKGCISVNDVGYELVRLFFKIYWWFYIKKSILLIFCERTNSSPCKIVIVHLSVSWCWILSILHSTTWFDLHFVENTCIYIMNCKTKICDFGCILAALFSLVLCTHEKHIHWSIGNDLFINKIEFPVMDN